MAKRKTQPSVFLPGGEPEFAPQAAAPPEVPAGEISRRRFLTLVSASAALASATSACSKIDRGAVVPYTRKPEEVVPGVANYYASTFQEGVHAYPVLVKAREGRPIHIEGNDEHPDFRGKTSPRVIADILRLYDPDRLRRPLLDGKPMGWAQVDEKILPVLKAARASGAPVLLMTGAVLSPTRRALIDQLHQVLPGLVHVPFEAVAPHVERAAATAAFGAAPPTRRRLDRADVILSFDSDFLGGEGNVPAAVRAFANRRRVIGAHDSMNRLWVMEGGMSLTGARADERIRVKPSRAAAVAFALVRVLHDRYGVPLPAGVSPGMLAAFDLDRMAAESSIPAKSLHALARDLKKAGRRALVLAGEAVPVETHIAVHVLNVMLGAEGYTLQAGGAGETVTFAAPDALHRRLAGLLQGRPHKLAAAIFWDVNPAYSLPDAALWKSLVDKVPLRIAIGLHADETARDCNVVLAENHWLESWGDYRTSSGILALQQPVIGPLYDTRQGEDVLLGFIRALGGSVPDDYHAFLRARWQKEVFPGGPVLFERFWLAALHDGVARIPAATVAARSLRGTAIADAVRKATAKAPAGFELVLRPGLAVYDGRYGNNGWIQEWPDPLTRVTWANPLLIAPADAERLGLDDGHVVRVAAGGREVELPILVQPGQTPGVITGTLGYGRRAPSVARGVGVNLYPLADGALPAPAFRAAVKLSRTGKREELPITQGHQRMEGRDIVRRLSLAAYSRGEAEPAEEEPISLYPEQPFSEYKWGMAIDLAACVGCGACVVACQSENNIPVVGPQQVVKGREMHWMRVDRYYEGSSESPRVLRQPMLCQQCDNAPCEDVCPVNATNHSPDGLNQMVYNRCVGTRYCANNCPYKVRRFNYFDLTSTKTEPESLVFNPEVTIRPRGVMEKCTFCLQRIQDKRFRAKAEKRDVRDGEIAPACAVACPSDAIVFGNLKDRSSQVARLSANDRGYHVLAELGVRPAITYLADLANTTETGGDKHEA